MSIVGGLDVHRAQITYDYLDVDTGEVEAGRIVPATRLVLRDWLARFDGLEAGFATEGCTGWRFVVEELRRAGVEAHLAEPADTATLRGRKRRAKTDRADARHLRQLLSQDRLPESWIAPPHVLETRIKGRLYVTLMDQRRAGSNGSTPNCSTRGWRSDATCWPPSSGLGSSRPICLMLAVS